LASEDFLRSRRPPIPSALGPARAFFSDELRERVTGLDGAAPEIRFVEVAALVDNGASVPA
jgi:hypothetical protein